MCDNKLLLYHPYLYKHFLKRTLMLHMGQSHSIVNDSVLWFHPKVSGSLIFQGLGLAISILMPWYVNNGLWIRITYLITQNILKNRATSSRSVANTPLTLNNKVPFLTIIRISFSFFPLLEKPFVFSLETTTNIYFFETEMRDAVIILIINYCCIAALQGKAVAKL